LFMALVSLFGVPAFAAHDPCVDFMPCGVYEGSGAWYNADGSQRPGEQFSEKIEITKVDDLAVNIKVWIYQGAIGQPWTDAKIQFNDEGHFFVQSSKGYEFGSGYCNVGVCNVAFYPGEVKKDKMTFVNAFVNTLRFEGAMLKRYNMVSNSTDDAAVLFQRSTLTKK
jgi:hypothetical protein